ncbi:AAA-ATPase At3g50940-like [Fagus crenata]
MPSTTSVLSTYTSFAASAMLLRTVINEVQSMTSQLIPQQLQEKILSRLGGLLGKPSSQMTLIIDESKGISINEIYQASEIYLSTIITPSIEHLKVSKAPHEKNLSITINKGEKIIHEFEGIHFVTPAEVAEELMKSEDPDIALTGLVAFLQQKKKKQQVKCTEEEKVNEQGKQGPEMEEEGEKKVKKECKRRKARRGKSRR